MPESQDGTDGRWTAELDVHCARFDGARRQYDKAIQARDVKAAREAFARMQEAAKMIDDLLSRSGGDVDDLLT